ncbi:MAG: M48 family metallopeptidase [Endomicrobium sp.]|jgi:STE24 endopeptidase|nr:M48 family metallopeptidase [Endomicrobium sp.]
MSFVTYLILSFLVIIYIVETTADLLNVKNISLSIPREFDTYFDKEKYVRSQQYLKANTKVSLISSTLFLVIQIVFVLSGGFNYVNTIATSFGFGPIWTGLIFAGILLFSYEIIKIPFSVYSTFVIEQNFGFNRTNVKTFVTDLFKSWIITAVISSIVFSVILWLFTNTPHCAWLYAFVCITVFQLFVWFIAPIVILPLFNKYTPLEGGELRTSIETYASKENFKMKGVFVMDESKRSTKSNAFFIGFGKFRRIVLFDTLIQKQTVNELTNILAHEMGHFKLGHTTKRMIFSFASTGVMLYILSLFVNKTWLYDAFLMQAQPIYAGVIFFAFLYAPISFIISVISSYFSRRMEYNADSYAAITYGYPEAMVTALKKLSVDNLSNLHPHKLKVFLEYSHPPILDRIKAINTNPDRSRA